MYREPNWIDAMGNLLGKNKMHEPQNSRNDDIIRIGGGRMSSSNQTTQKSIPLPLHHFHHKLLLLCLTNQHMIMDKDTMFLCKFEFVLY
jgi:hypothetical protein